MQSYTKVEVFFFFQQKHQSKELGWVGITGKEDIRRN